MKDVHVYLAIFVPKLMIQLGEVNSGGVGSGLYGMIAFAVMEVFIAEIMSSRAPEYLSKK